MLLTVLIIFIILQHIGFMIAEIFLWNKPLGRKIFQMSSEKALVTHFLAKNQGLYNGFLAAGLLWGLFTDNPVEALHIKIFFLSCIVVAGVYGSLTALKSIFWIQGLPALLTLILMRWF